MSGVHNNQDIHFFENLYRNVFEGKAIHSYYLVYHKTNGFQLEAKSVHWFWRLWHRLTTTSYNLHQHAVTLIERLVALDTNNSAELAAALRVSKVMTGIIQHPLQKPHDRQVWKGLENRYSVQTNLLLSRIAKDSKIKAARLACETGKYESACKYLDDVAIPDDLLNEYGKILFRAAEQAGNEQFCLKYIAQVGDEVDVKLVKRYAAAAVSSNNFQRLEKLIGQGAAKHFTKAELLKYSAHAMQLKMSSCALALIKLIHDRQERLPDGSTLLHRACEHELVDVVKFLLANDGNINAKDSQGNTALHIASSLLNAELFLLLLSKGADCSLQNNAERAPLYYASKMYKNNASYEDFVQIVFVDFPVVQNVLETKGVAVLLDTLDTRADELVASSGVKKALELAILFQDVQLAKNIVRTISEEHFFAAIDELARSYSPNALAVVELAPFSLNKAHFKQDVLAGAISKPNENISIQEWIRLFDELNLTSAQEEDFFDCSKLLIPYEMRSRIQLRASLRTMVSRIVNETSFLGTPDAGTDALHLFYATIKKALQHVLLHLRKEHGNPEYVKMLHGAFEALFLCMNQCGGRYYETAVTLYLKICKKCPDTFDQMLYTILSEYRDLIIHTIVDENRNENSVHDYNAAVEKLGVELGLPLAEERATFHDRYIGAGVDISLVKKKFGERYTPYTLLYEWIMPKLKVEVELKDRFLQYAKSTMPDEWNKKHYDALYTHLRDLRKASKSDKEIKASLEEHDIYLKDNKETFEEAIEADRISLFLAKEVHDETTGAIKHSFILKTLVTCQIYVSAFEA